VDAERAKQVEQIQKEQPKTLLSFKNGSGDVEIGQNQQQQPPQQTMPTSSVSQGQVLAVQKVQVVEEKKDNLPPPSYNSSGLDTTTDTGEPQPTQPTQLLSFK